MAADNSIRRVRKLIGNTKTSITMMRLHDDWEKREQKYIDRQIVLAALQDYEKKLESTGGNGVRHERV